MFKRKLRYYFISYKIYYSETEGIEKDAIISLKKKIKTSDIENLRNNLLNNSNEAKDFWKSVTILNIKYIGKEKDTR